MFKINLVKRNEVLFLSDNPKVVMQNLKGRQAYYELEILGSDVHYWVYATFGKIGTNYKKQKIGSFNHIREARKFFQKKMGEKLAKGYEIISSKT